jgi:hypothetical protein
MDKNDLAQKLLEVGIQLEHLLYSRNELVNILEQVKNYLSMVEQFPSEKILDTMFASLSTLAKSDLSRIQDKDVRLVVNH